MTNTVHLSFLKIIILFALCFYSSCSKKNDYAKPSWAKIYYNLNGEIKSVTFTLYSNSDSLILIKSYSFDKKGRPIVDILEEGGKKEKYTHKYNGNEKLWNLSFNISDVSEKCIFENELLKSKSTWIDSLDSEKRLIKQSKIVDNEVVSEAELKYSSLGHLEYCRLNHFKDNEIFIDSFTYDKKGLLRKDVFTRYNRDSTQIRKIIKLYNKNGSLRTSKSYYDTNDLDNMELFYYDSLGKLTEYVLYYDDSVAAVKAQINYNSIGQKTDSIVKSFWDEGTKSKTEIFKYNTNENLVTYVYLDADSVKSKLEYFYYPDKKLEREVHRHANGKTVIYYDNFGNKLLWKKFNQSDSLVWEQKRVMEYDDKRNVIKCEVFENDSITEFFKAKIEYY